jgi:hypothetical protein
LIQKFKMKEAGYLLILSSEKKEKRGTEREVDAIV